MATGDRPALTQTPASPATDRQAEYRSLMRKWWFAAAVGAPTMLPSYPWLILGLRDRFPRSSEQLWWLCQMGMLRGRIVAEAA